MELCVKAARLIWRYTMFVLIKIMLKVGAMCYCKALMDEELYHIFLVARNIVAPWRDLCLKLVPWLRVEHAHMYVMVSRWEGAVVGC